MNASLRILHTESSLGWGGQEIRVLTEARGVARSGHQVAIAAAAESRIFADPSDQSPTTSGCVSCSSWSGGGTPGTNGTFAVFTPRLAR